VLGPNLTIHSADFSANGALIMRKYAFVAAALAVLGFAEAALAEEATKTEPNTSGPAAMSDFGKFSTWFAGGGRSMHTP
jgi:hypothetical protein